MASTGGVLWLALQGNSTTGRARGAYLININTTGAKPYLLIGRNVKLASPGCRATGAPERRFYKNSSFGQKHAL